MKLEAFDLGIITNIAALSQDEVAALN